MTLLDTLTLERSMFEQMLEHAYTSLPMEAVGLLGGDASGHALVALPLPNLAGHRTFLADPYAQFQAQRTLQLAGLTLLAVYHSHPGGGAGLSAQDVYFATRLPVVHIVIAIGRTSPLADEMRAYSVGEQGVSEIEVHIV